MTIPTLVALSAMAQNRFYVVMKDGTAESYPSEKVDSLSFDAPNGFKVMGFGDLMDAVSSMRDAMDSIVSVSNAREKALNAKIETISNNAAANEKALNSKIDSISKAAIANEKALNTKMDSISNNAITNEKALNSKIDSISKVAAANEVSLKTQIDSLSNELALVKKYGTEMLKKYGTEMLEKYGVEMLEKYGVEMLEKYGAEMLDKYGAEALENNNDKYVDLGLPSGTLWATYNVGASVPEGYGEYFAWGETEIKETYTSGDSKCYGKSIEELREAGVIDENNNLTAEYDAATKMWGEEWRMPIRAEMEELMSLANEYAVVNGVEGRKIIGTNGNTLFLPFAGYRYEGGLGYAGENGYYWSASVYESGRYDAYCLGVYSEDADLYYDYRYYRQSVRPVLRTK